MRSVSRQAFPLFGLLAYCCVVHCSAQYIPQSVLKNPPKDAVVISTWAFLKESMEKMGNQVMQLLAVKRDAQSIEDDLVAQKVAWQQAELEMRQENAKLQAEKEAIEVEVGHISGARSLWLDMRSNISYAKAQVELLEETRQREETHRVSERASLQQRQRDVKLATDKLEATMLKERQQAWYEAKSLQDDAKVMNHKIANMKKTIEQLTQQERTQQIIAETELKGLAWRLGKLNASRTGFRKKLEPAWVPKQQLKDLQDKLQADTKELLTLQNTENTHQIKCQSSTLAGQNALKAKRASLAARSTDLRQICDRSHGIQEVLTHEVAACNEVLRPHHQDFNRKQRKNEREKETEDDEETD